MPPAYDLTVSAEQPPVDERDSAADDREAGQLDLGLAATRPSIPDGLRPMRGRPAPGPFDSPHHLFEPVWSGRRVLAHLALTADGRPALRLIDARGRDVGPCFPELGPMAAAMPDAPLVLDGELVIPDRTGRADPVALAGRCRLPSSPSASITPTPSGLPEQPAVLLVFDVLFLAGRPLLAEPLRRRLDRLDRLLEAGGNVLRVPAVHVTGIELHDAARAQGLPAIRARRVDSPYLPGQRSSLWRIVPVAASGPAAHRAIDPGGPGSGAGPILAIFSRLPLHDA